MLPLNFTTHALVIHSYPLKHSSSIIFNVLDQSVLPTVHEKYALHGPVLVNKFPFSVRWFYQRWQANRFKLSQNAISDLENTFRLLFLRQDTIP